MLNVPGAMESIKGTFHTEEVEGTGQVVTPAYLRLYLKGAHSSLQIA